MTKTQIMQETCLDSYDLGVAEKNNTPNATAISKVKMARSTMTINTQFNVPVETFCGEYSPTAISNVVPEQTKKKHFFFPKWFFFCFLRNKGRLNRKRF